MTISDERLSASALVPYAMTDPLRIPRERYFDREFFELEKEHLWPHVWQMACRLEEIPDPGDFVEYEICDMSILVVRQHDGSVKAFENACRHRATQLAVGAGRFGGGQIVCPFHGWRWNLDGSNSFVVSLRGERSARVPRRGGPPAARVPGRALGRLRVDQHGPRRAAAARGVGAGRRDPRRRRRRQHAREVLEGSHPQLQLEDRAGGVPRGLHVMQTHPQLTIGAGERSGDRSDVRGVRERARHGSRGGVSEMPRRRLHRAGPAAVAGSGRDDARARVSDCSRACGTGCPDGRTSRPPPCRRSTSTPRAPASRCRRSRTPHIWGGEVFLFPNFFMLPQYGELARRTGSVRTTTIPSGAASRCGR